MITDKFEIRSVKELVRLLEPGESFVTEQVLRSPDYPNIPEEIVRIRIVKTSDADG